MTKLLLNSLYGKYGQRNSTKTEIVDSESRDIFMAMMNDSETFEIYGEDGVKFVRLGDDIFRISKQEGEFARDSIPIIASAVTSYARVLLYSLIRTAGPENVIYTDTDSLFVTKDGLQRLNEHIDSSTLGKLKIEKSGTVVILGAKDYTFNGITKLKGVKKSAEKLSDSLYRQSRFETKNTRYRKGTPDGVVMVTPIYKSITHKYDKGIVLGEYVTPFTLSEC